MQKSIKKNYLFNTAYQILTLITPLITTPYVSRILGADGIGTYSFADSVTSYFVLAATMGISIYGQREISYFQNDRQKRSDVFWNTKILECITSAITLIVFYIFAIFSSNGTIFFVLSMNILAVMFDVTWLFQGMEEFGIITLRNTIFKFLNIAFIFVFVKQKSDLIIYIAGIAGFALISNLSLWTRLRQYVDRPQKENIRPLKNIKIVVSLFIPTIAIQVYTVLDKTMIGLITRDSFQNGYYEQAIKMSRMALMLVTSLGTVMIPRIGHHYSIGEKKIVNTLMYRSYNFVWFLGIPLCFGLIGIADNFVPWFFGNGYGAVTPLLRILSCLILAIGINNVTGMQYLIPTGRQNIFTKTVLVGAVVNVIMNALLIPIFKANGAAVASVVAETTIAVIQLILVRKEIKGIQVLKILPKYLISGLVMLVSLLWVNQFLEKSILDTILLIVMGAAIYLIILFILKDKFLIENTKLVLSKVIGRKEK